MSIHRISALAALAATILFNVTSPLATAVQESSSTHRMDRHRPPSQSTPSPPSLRPVRYVLAQSGLPTSAVLLTRRNEKVVSPLSTPGNVTYGPCTLFPRAVHLRNSLNREAVGVKPLTKCTRPVQKIRHATELHFHWFTLVPQAGPTYVETSKPKSAGVLELESKNVAYKCDGREETLWMGTSTGSIRFNGRTYHARVYHAPRPLDCGADWP